ncbi:Grixazone synthase [Rhypophila decipiens]
MKLHSLIAAFLTLATGIDAIRGAVWNTDETDPEHEADKQNSLYWAAYSRNMNWLLINSTSWCNEKTVKKRVDWQWMEETDRLNYIKAVQCLYTIDSGFDRETMPGARSRYDDFVGTHLLQTPYIHFDGLFLAFHRHYLHQYNLALQDECDYYGPVPYWDWSKHWKDPLQAAVLDGSDTSFGSDGEYIPNRNDSIVKFPHAPEVIIPPGTGGGCLKDGPFKDYKMNLGPVLLEPQGPDGGRGFNPRCINRDISKLMAGNSRPSNLTKVLAAKDLGEFNLLIDDAASGVHTNGHFQLGGIQLDPFVSPSDPIFWLHHGMIDYLWSVWQGQDYENRRDQVWGTGTLGNIPPSDNVTLDTLINFEVLSDGPRPVREFVSTIEGPYCYVYW